MSVSFSERADGYAPSYGMSAPFIPPGQYVHGAPGIDLVASSRTAVGFRQLPAAYVLHSLAENPLVGEADAFLRAHRNRLRGSANTGGAR